jgi:hypothetical protein
MKSIGRCGASARRQPPCDIVGIDTITREHPRIALVGQSAAGG